MSAVRRRASGYTLVELLMVIAIQGVLISELLPAVQHVRQKLNQELTDSRIREIASAQAIFRNTDSDADLLDDYGTLAELAAAGLVILDLADGQHAGYVYQVGTRMSHRDRSRREVRNRESRGSRGDRTCHRRGSAARYDSRPGRRRQHCLRQQWGRRDGARRTLRGRLAGRRARSHRGTRPGGRSVHRNG
ncbi:MAG: type II secretion system protein [Deltaproteobacteria bacterium]|nr:type II secretion system protein [Deltaproteobacteria bacterium]